MNLPPIHNKRSPQQWEIISKHIDFKDKTVIDLGCGFGDILFRCWQAGANGVTGIDNNRSILQELADFAKEKDISIKELFLILLDLNRIDDIRFMLMSENTDVFADITICFSVLPYLREPALALQWMRIHSDISLIECQYSGDGPGFDFIKNDEDMQEWLEDIGWQSVKIIGWTLVEGRNKERDIWLCQ